MTKKLAKRRVIVTIEYLVDYRNHQMFKEIDNLRHIVEEYMPYVKVINLKDEPIKEE
jgi:hypothetical protein